jgi:hypothetical protein
LPVVAVASGRGQVALGSASGVISLLDRELHAVSFQVQRFLFLFIFFFPLNHQLKAHEFAVTRLQQLVQRNVLVSVGNDDEAVSPTIKLWNCDKLDRDGLPFLMRAIRLTAAGTTTPAAASSNGGSGGGGGGSTAVPVTAFACTEDLSQIAVGLRNGQVVLIRGSDVSRDRSPKQKLLSSGSDTPVTGLVWRTVDQHTVLYVVTTTSVASFWTSAKDRDKRVDLDNKGAEIGCVTQSDEGDAVIARDEAVYFYMPESLGACFGFEGRKRSVLWFRSYLVTVSDAGNVPAASISVYDLKNKFVAYTEAKLPTSIRHVVAEWGSLFVICADGSMLQLEEKDTQTKLDTLFKKNLFTSAINLARSQQTDAAQISDIYRKYGDHLHSKGDYDGAMQQYLFTIGRLEPSYVIRKFLDAQRIHNLTQYLETLHERGFANSDHTQLLLNCLSKLKDHKKLEAFIKSDTVHFEVETAIRVCRQAGYYTNALYLARAHRRHDWALRILLDDLHDYERALRHMAALPFDEVEQQLKTHGKTLLDCNETVRAAATKLLFQLCTNYTPTPLSDAEIAAAPPLHAAAAAPATASANGDSSAAAAAAAASSTASSAVSSAAHAAEEGLAMIGHTLSTSLSAVRKAGDQARNELFGRAAPNRASASGALPPTEDLSDLLGPLPSSSGAPASSSSGKASSSSSRRANPAEYIHIFVNQPQSLVSFLERVVADGTIKCDPAIYTTLLELYLKSNEGNSDKALALLRSPQAQFDVDHALMLCQMHNYRPGLLRLYELTHMYDEILRLHMAAGDHRAVVQTCQRNGETQPALWVRALSYFADRSPECDDELREVVTHIERHNLLPPLMVVQTLARNERATLGAIKAYIMRYVTTAEQRRADDERRANKLRDETAAMRAEIAELRGGAVLFQANKCSQCSSAIELPAVHFLCKHSFHTRCVDDAENECPLCAPERHELTERAAAEAAAAERHEEFFGELSHAQDGFDVIAEHFGKNIFNQVVQLGGGTGDDGSASAQLDDNAMRQALMTRK